MNNSVKSSKDNILNVALKVFGRFGFYKTTMSDIAKAAQKGRRTLYTYFKNKEEIFDAVVQREVSQTIEKLRLIVDSSLDPENKLREYLLVRMRLIYDLANLNDALKKDFLKDYHRVEEIRQDLDRDELILLAKILQEGKDKNVFKINDSETIATSILYANKGFEVPFIRQNFNEKCQLQLAEFIGAMFHGLVIE